MDGKPVAPKLATLEVNLKGVFYSKQQSSYLHHAHGINSHFGDCDVAVHLGMHYVKHNRAPGSWKAIVMIGSMGAYSSPCASVVLREQSN